VRARGVPVRVRAHAVRVRSARADHGGGDTLFYLSRASVERGAPLSFTYRRSLTQHFVRDPFRIHAYPLPIALATTTTTANHYHQHHHHHHHHHHARQPLVPL